MSKKLFSLYEEEIAFITEEISKYGQRFPKVQNRLNYPEDPHVSRLIESFALLNARMRLKIEDEFPELCQSLLHALYPQYMAPVPSTAICRFEMDSVGAELVDGHRIARGTTLETEEIYGYPCSYRTCSELQLFPIKVTSCSYHKPPFKKPTESSWAEKSEAALQIELGAISEKLDWSKLKIDQLRFFLGGITTCANKILETLFRDALGVGIYSSVCPQGVFISSDRILQCGFAPEESILDADPRTIPAYRILWEYFVAPEKFRFVSLNLKDVWSKVAGSNLTIVVYLKSYHSLITNQISQESIQLGCVPVANLFPLDSEPIRLTENRTNYPVVPSYRATKALEVHSVLSVQATHPKGHMTVAYQPFFRPNHRIDQADRDRYWQLQRQRPLVDVDEGDRGSEVFLTIVDLQGRPKPSDEWTLHVKTLCCNRDLVSKLTVKSSVTYNGGPAKAYFSTAPTPTRRPYMQDDWTWRIISHLSLNHLALSDTQSGAELLREVLRLYINEDQDQDKSQKVQAVESVLNVRYQRATAKLLDGGNGPGICRGLEIEIEVDEERLEVYGIYLFASILDHFFSLFASINSFTRLIMVSKGRRHRLFEGKARSGCKNLI